MSSQDLNLRRFNLTDNPSDNYSYQELLPQPHISSPLSFLLLDPLSYVIYVYIFNLKSLKHQFLFQCGHTGQMKFFFV